MHFPVFTVAEMQDAERRSGAEYGVSLSTLMRRAGLGLARAAHAMLGRPEGPVWVFCGSGNNGGDGYVCASDLRGWDVPATVIAGPHLPATGSLAGAARDRWLSLGGRVIEVASGEALEVLMPSVADQPPALVIDAIFGTGLTRPVTGIYADMIEYINRLAVSVLACDVPSGVNGDTGQIMGVAVRATQTLMMGLAKPACQIPPSSDYFGAADVCDILPPQLVTALLR